MCSTVALNLEFGVGALLDLKGLSFANNFSTCTTVSLSGVDKGLLTLSIYYVKPERLCCEITTYSPTTSYTAEVGIVPSQYKLCRVPINY